MNKPEVLKGKNALHRVSWSLCGFFSILTLLEAESAVFILRKS